MGHMSKFTYTNSTTADFALFLILKKKNEDTVALHGAV